MKKFRSFSKDQKEADALHQKRKQLEKLLNTGHRQPDDSEGRPMYASLSLEERRKINQEINDIIMKIAKIYGRKTN